MDLLFSLAEIKCIQSKHRVFKSFAIKQSESSINFKEIFIFSDINQSESTFKGREIFNKYNVKKLKLSSTSHGFFNIFDTKQSELNIFFGNTVCWKSTKQNPAISKSELFIIFKKT